MKIKIYCEHCGFHTLPEKEHGDHLLVYREEIAADCPVCKTCAHCSKQSQMVLEVDEIARSTDQVDRDKLVALLREARGLLGYYDTGNNTRARDFMYKCAVELKEIPAPGAGAAWRCIAGSWQQVDQVAREDMSNDKS